MTEKIKLTGQLLEDNKSVILAIEDDLQAIAKIAKEYKTVFPNIFLSFEEQGAKVIIE